MAFFHVPNLTFQGCNFLVPACNHFHGILVVADHVGKVAVLKKRIDVVSQFHVVPDLAFRIFNHNFVVGHFFSFSLFYFHQEKFCAENFWVLVILLPLFPIVLGGLAV